MKKLITTVVVISGMLIMTCPKANAQWTRNAVNGYTYATYPTDKIGIGTNAPSYNLDIKQDFNCSFRVQSKVNGSANLILSRPNNTLNCLVNYKTGTNAVWYTGCQGNDDFRISNGANTNVLNINQNGNVGIGTQAPSQKLDVAGTIQANNTVTVDAEQTNNGLVTGNVLKLGGDISGEAIGSKRTAGGNRFGMDFYTASTNRMTITNLGNVGIGTTTPVYKLDVIAEPNKAAIRALTGNTSNYTSLEIGRATTEALIGIVATPGNYSTDATAAGDVVLRTESTGQKLLLQGGSGASAMAILGNKVGIGTITPSATLAVKNTNLTGIAAQASFQIGELNSDNMVFDMNEIQARNNGVASNLFLNNWGGNISMVNGVGNVGIGTQAPANKLSVSGDANVDGLMLIRNSVNPLAYGRLQHSGNNGNFHIDTYGTGGLFLNYFSGTNTYIGNGANGINVAFLNNGNVGIGTSAPGYKLDVCGTIRAKEVRVETGWCDYVFANDYKLAPLSEVESYILANKHLPDVTPGAEIESNGLEVGKVSAQMIKKIEELTLYVIDQQKKIDKLQSQVEDLKSNK